MKQVKEIFTKKLEQHKKLVSNMVRTEDKGMIVAVRNTGEKLALAYTGCKCEKCKTEENLQYHHLVQRNVKEYTNFWKYISQRHYWANILILCLKCHAEIENRRNNGLSGTISISYIQKVKKEFGIGEKNE